METYRASKNRGRSITKCNTDKTAQYSCDMKVKTSGLLLACTPCNIILNVKEFYGTESCSALFYLETRKNFIGNIYKLKKKMSHAYNFYVIEKGPISNFLIYDAACKLMPFCVKRSTKSERATCLKDIDYVVDKLHIKGHIGKNFKKFCHPDNFPQLKPLNTVVGEQKNFWLGKYKYSLKHMGMTRFNFFVFIICDSYNQLNIENKIGFIVNNDISEKSERLKRKIDEIEMTSEDLNDTSGFFSDTNDSHRARVSTKRIKI